MSHTYDFPRPALTVDAVVLSRDPEPQVLLIRRGHPPFEGRWAIPGGFVNEGERLEDAAARELGEETGVAGDPAGLELIGAYGDPGRDPRGWVVSIAYLARVDRPRVAARGGDDAAEARWFPARTPPPLAFDHARILGDALARASAG